MEDRVRSLEYRAASALDPEPAPKSRQRKTSDGIRGVERKKSKKSLQNFDFYKIKTGWGTSLDDSSMDHLT